ncbi:DedA family protein [Candidatus Methylospira mobilis]|uniref:DedA family protein n=2 Tax=Candidatus Methylospira mobilis TaxID=1808979 RepID=A0A5Q0BMI2_9GAMM|nr:DedA family protein [Candidatus Methylospira mobilis]
MAYIGLFMSAFVSSTVAPGGSEAVLAYMAIQDYSAPWLIVVATLGNTLGAVSTWYLGLWVARKYPADRVMNDRQRQGIAWVRRWGAPVLLLSWLPVAGDAFCFAAGWLRLPLLLSALLILAGKAARYAVVVQLAGMVGA